MYYLKQAELGSYKSSDVNQFVECWSSYYKYRVKELNSDKLIDYFSELNVGSELTEKNVTNLLRWKDPRYLTRTILSGPNKGRSNPKVDKVLSKIELLNGFRNSEITESEFRKETNLLFSHGVIWGIFLFHVCKPMSYPIADQHVFRSHAHHKNCTLPTGWEKYFEYKEYFDEMMIELNGVSTGNSGLQKQKKLDSALMVFGQFLKSYGLGS